MSAMATVERSIRDAFARLALPGVISAYLLPRSGSGLDL
jgi:hypothetical protein